MTAGWRQQGACATGDPDRFFTTKGRPPQHLVDICRGCVSLIPCTFESLRVPVLGFQAGMGKPERDRLRRWDRQARERLASEAQKREATP